VGKTSTPIGEKFFRSFGRKTEGRMSLGRSGHGCGDNIKINLKKMGWEVLDWIHLAQDRYQ
jgi:hypothetical protein